MLVSAKCETSRRHLAVLYLVIDATFGQNHEDRLNIFRESGFWRGREVYYRELVGLEDLTTYTCFGVGPRPFLS